MAKAIGASMFKNFCRKPFHAEIKISEALKNSTGSDNKRLIQVKVSFNPVCSIFPPEKYSGKLNIIILEKQKPATPILYICLLLNVVAFFVTASFSVIVGS